MMSCTCPACSDQILCNTTFFPSCTKTSLFPVGPDVSIMSMVPTDTVSKVFSLRMYMRLLALSKENRYSPAGKRMFPTMKSLSMVVLTGALKNCDCAMGTISRTQSIVKSSKSSLRIYPPLCFEEVGAENFGGSPAPQLAAEHQGRKLVPGFGEELCSSLSRWR